jgi:hypothetical protein
MDEKFTSDVCGGGGGRGVEGGGKSEPPTMFL